jgi:hypothetical protein
MQGADTAYGDHIRPEYRELLPLDSHTQNLSVYIFQKNFQNASPNRGRDEDIVRETLQVYWGQC